MLHGHWKTATFVAGLGQDGITALCVIGRAMSGDIFLTSVEQCLAPTMARGEAAGATLLYLPPYSPDRRPLELAFAKLKALLRRAAPRSIGSALSQSSTPEHAV